MELGDKEAKEKLTTRVVTGGLHQNGLEVTAKTGIRAGLLTPAILVAPTTREKPYSIFEQSYYWLMDDGSVKEFRETYTLGAGEARMRIRDLGTKVGINGRVVIDADGKTSLVFDKVPPVIPFSIKEINLPHTS